MEQELAISGSVNLLLALLLITLSWWALQALKLDKFFTRPNDIRGKLLQVLLAIALGSQLTSFVLNYIGWSQMTIGFF
jgi:uncharacterized integral membrane protein (TIGR02327 family)